MVSIQYDFKPEYAIARLSGEVASQSEHLDHLKKLYKDIVAEKKRLFIIDERKFYILSDNLSEMKLLRWLKEFVQMKISHAAIAFLVREDRLEVELKLSGYFHKVGLNIDVFTSEKTATKWLLEQDSPNEGLSVEVKYQSEPEYLLVNVEGEVADQDTHLDYLKEVYETAKAKEYSHVILDERNLQINSGLLSELKLVSWVKTVAQDKSMNGLALVVSKDRINTDKQLADFFRKSGFNMKVFIKVKDAVKWILKQ